MELTAESVERFDKDYNKYRLKHQEAFGKNPAEVQEVLVDQVVKVNMAMRLRKTTEQLAAVEDSLGSAR